MFFVWFLFLRMEILTRIVRLLLCWVHVMSHVLILCMWRPLQVLGRHRHPAEASELREAGQSAPADQLLGEHPTGHVPLPEVPGFSL